MSLELTLPCLRFSADLLACCMLCILFRPLVIASMSSLLAEMVNTLSAWSLLSGVSRRLSLIDNTACRGLRSS